MKLEFVPINRPRFRKGDIVRETREERNGISDLGQRMTIDSIDRVDGWVRCVWRSNAYDRHSWWFSPDAVELCLKED